MIIGESFVVLNSCIQKYSKEEGGLVEKTNLGNCLLNVIAKIDEIELIWEFFKGKSL